MSHAGKLDPIVWAEFEKNPEKLIYESEKLLAQRMGKTIEEYTEISIENLPEGKTREVVVRQRVNQQFFRNTVLSAYDYHCCITGINISSLLEACHISSWKNDISNRMNPKNGLCMTPTFHRAYDMFLIAITPDYEIVLSDEMLDGAKDEKTLKYLRDLQGRQIRMPEKFAPEQEFLAQHFEAYRQRR